ncbi:MAG: galactokinase [Pseudomonadota bacterium]
MHAETFGSQPLAEAFAPGRVNLIGEHTDYNGGSVLPMALGIGVKVTLGRARGGVDEVASARFEGAAQRPPGQGRQGNWADYAFGALDQARYLGWLDGPATLFIDSNLPDGAGVSSSAALVTAILRAASTSAGVDDTLERRIAVAKAARAVENDYIGLPCGIMDQMAVGLARSGEALALDCLTLRHETLPVPSDWQFTVLHSGVRRSLNDGRYTARFDECAAAAQALGVATLCQIPVLDTASMKQLPAPLNRRVRHVVGENARTLEAIAALRGADFDRFGALMNQSHESYSKDFEASTPEVDALIASARTAGAKGARLTGGGFGGCLVLLTRPDAAADVIAELKERYPTVWRVN